MGGYSWGVTGQDIDDNWPGRPPDNPDPYGFDAWLNEQYPVEAKQEEQAMKLANDPLDQFVTQVWKAQKTFLNLRAGIARAISLAEGQHPEIAEELRLTDQHLEAIRRHLVTAVLDAQARRK